MTSYTEIYDIFLSKISDVKILSLSDEDIEQLLESYMFNSIAFIKECKTDLTDVDSENKCFKNDLLSIEKELIASEMVVQWLEPQLNSTLLTKQFFGGKEEKFYAQANQLEKLQDLYDYTRINVRKISRDYTYQSYIKDNLS